MCLFTSATGKILCGVSVRCVVDWSMMWPFVILMLDWKVAYVTRDESAVLEDKAAV